MYNKRISPDAFVSRLKDGMSIMFGGFMGCGTPERIVGLLLDSGVRDLTLIGNDSVLPNTGVGVLVANRRVKRLIASHIGTNPLTGQQMINGELDVELVPQGTLAERIRCGGAGLGGVLTQTGVGTVVGEGKTHLTFDGVEYLVERPLRADMAIVKARAADEAGNLVYDKTARNFNPLVAMAADWVIAEVDELLPLGSLDPEAVITPGVMISALMLTEES